MGSTRSDVKSIQATLATTTEDIVKLTQFWDYIEIENKDAAQPLYVRFDGTAATAAGAGTEYVGPTKTKVFKGGIVRPGGIPGNTTTPPHYISLIGSGNAYSVVGVAGAL